MDKVASTALKAADQATPSSVKWAALGAAVAAPIAGAVAGPLGAAAGAVAGAQSGAALAAVFDPQPTSWMHGTSEHTMEQAPTVGELLAERRAEGGGGGGEEGGVEWGRLEDGTPAAAEVVEMGKEDAGEEAEFEAGADRAKADKRGGGPGEGPDGMMPPCSATADANCTLPDGAFPPPCNSTTDTNCTRLPRVPPLDGGMGPCNATADTNCARPDGPGPPRGQQGGRVGAGGSSDGAEGAWNSMNDAGEREFDDRRSPRKVAFRGTAPDFRVYPNSSDPSVFLRLRFGAIRELDASGRPLRGHGLASLAGATQGANFSVANQTVNGVNLSAVTIAIAPALQPGFGAACAAPAASAAPPPAPEQRRRSRHLLQDSTTASTSTAAGTGPTITLTLLFGLDAALQLPYGDRTVTVPRNGLKWSVAVTGWPFCNESNTLALDLDLLLSSNATASLGEADSLGDRTLTLALTPAVAATMAFPTFALDGPSGAAKMAVGLALQLPPPPCNATGDVDCTRPFPPPCNATDAGANCTRPFPPPCNAMEGTNCTRPDGDSAGPSGRGRGGDRPGGPGGPNDGGRDGGIPVATIRLTLPNPALYGASDLYYDPMEATSTVYDSSGTATYESGSTADGSSSPSTGLGTGATIGIIVACVVGGVALLAVVVVGTVVLVRRRRAPLSQVKPLEAV
ncbi:hypothetical protein HYH03_017571 [Edaphochlamys debaryana]|uniref:Uncharacterized protein n=1 Tax=Edaphochlamys debaryana TaxID=47281 RepID=A0A836BQA3_9CHLO|nr:hypothetical protein HYH03_017571 [Edaphochlamys debaryana]|eukprot:KAG2483564.1 hypothetical protein HYH03_017571 [Edaphochlamys debaryana]